MPIRLGTQTQAIRAIKGDVNTPTVWVDGIPLDIEFKRIYFGNDLKFDKYSSYYFNIKNTGSSNITVRLTKYGSSWNSSTAPDMKIILPHISSTKNSIVYGQSYTIPAGEMACFVNDCNTAGAGFSQSTDNYMTFSLSGSGSARIGGSWSSLAQCFRDNEDNVNLPDYCFYKMFNNGIPSTISTRVDTTPVSSSKAVTAGKYCFGHWFAGTNNAKNGIYRIEPMTFMSLGRGAFESAFYHSNIQQCGGIFSEYCERGNAFESIGVFSWAFAYCTNLQTAPKLCKPKTYWMFSDVPYTYYETFLGCTNMHSIAEQFIYTKSGAGGIIGEYTFFGTFSGCTNLFNGLRLKYDPILRYKAELVLYEKSFYRTFKNCTSLRRPIEAPWGGEYSGLVYTETYIPIFHINGISATEEMFYGCTALTSSSYESHGIYYPGMELLMIVSSKPIPFSNACQNMFYGCIALTYMLNVFGTLYLADNCCEGMFYGCTSLQKANVPSQIISGSSYTACFRNMFYGCTSLVQISGFNLPTTQANCCEGMFQNCSSLVSSPYLNAATIETDAYKNMFYGCSSLKMIITDQSQQGTNMNNWTYGLPTETWRKYIKTNTSNTGTQKNTSPNTSNANYIPYNWGVSSQALVFYSPGGAFTLRLNKIGSPQTRTIKYKFFNNNTEYTLSFNTNISVSANDGILLWSEEAANVKFSTSTSNYYQFQITTNRTEADVYCFGSLSALTKASPSLIIGISYTFYRLFYNCTKLVSAPNLPLLMNSSGYRFYQTFLNCTGLRFLQGISGTIINEGDFYMAFRDCTSLEQPLDLSSVTSIASMGCAEMYNGCTALKTVGQLPSSLRSTIGTYAFSYMYLNCKELLQIPSGYLPYTSISECCYTGMFYGCEGITSVPEDLLPATTLANGCYKQMFKNCGFRIAPYLPATTLVQDCYTEMFSGCKYLSKLNVEFTDWGNNNGYRNTKGWVTGVEIEDGQFYCQGSLASLYNNQYNLSNSNTISGISDQTACYIPYNWVRNPHGQIPDDVFRFTRVSGTTNILFSDTSKYEVSRDGWNWSTPSSSMPVNATYTVLCVRYKYYNDTYHRPYETISMSGTGTVNVSGNICYLFDKTGTASQCNCSYLFAGYSNVKDCSGMYFNGNPTVNAYQMFYNSGVTKVKRKLFNYTELVSATQAFMNCTSLVYGANCMCYNDELFSGIFKQTYKNCTALRSSIIDSGAPEDTTSRLFFGSTKTFTPQVSDEAFYQVCEGCSNANFTAIYLQLNKLAYNTSGTVYYTFQQAFKNCTHLAVVHSHQENWPGSTNTAYWLENTASSGNFYRRSTLPNIHGYANIPTGWNAPTWTPS